MSYNTWPVTSKEQWKRKITEYVCICVCMYVCVHLFISAHLTWHLRAHVHRPRAHTGNKHVLKKGFPDCSHVDCVSIRGQEWLVISQGSDSQNGPSGTLCHSAWVRACPIDPAQLSKPMRDARLRSSRDGLCCQGLWMMYNIRMVFVL